MLPVIPEAYQDLLKCIKNYDRGFDTTQPSDQTFRYLNDLGIASMEGIKSGSKGLRRKT